MKILSLTLLPFLFAVIVVNQAFGEMHQMRIVKFQSQSNLRSTFDGYLYESKNPKGLIVYLHGGGCRALQGQPIHLLETLPLNKTLVDLGYSLLIANYTEKINPTWLSRSGVDAAYPDLNNEERCKLATEIHLHGIRDMMVQISAFYSSGPIILMGHSYGAYLVNYLASDSVRLGNVAAYISYAGIWDEALRNQWSAEFHVSRKLNAVSHDPKNLGPILIIHSADDVAVNIDQLDSFKRWLGDSRRAYHQTLELKTGDHFSEDSKLNLQIARTIDRFINNVRP